MNVLIVILGWLIHTYVFIILLRYLCQWVGIPFTNQFMQLLYHLTRVWSVPLRNVFPTLFGMESSLLSVAYVLLLLKQCLPILLGASFSVAVFGLALVEGLVIAIDIFFFAILISVITQLLVPHLYHPVIQVTRGLSEPLLKPIRRAVPPMSGFDLSPLLAVMGLKIIEIILVYYF